MVYKYFGCLKTYDKNGVIINSIQRIFLYKKHSLAESVSTSIPPDFIYLEITQVYYN